MTDTTTTPEPERPFDPEAAGRIQALIDDIDRIRAQQPQHLRMLPVAPTLDGNTRHGARVSDLREVLRQRAYAKDEARQLAEKCHRLDGEREDALAKLAALKTEWGVSLYPGGPILPIGEDQVESHRAAGHYRIENRLVGEWTTSPADTQGQPS